MFNFSEAFLHHIWKFKAFDLESLSTIDGRTIELQYIGTHNENSGPDFHNARILIDDTLWAGHIEIHKRSSDWLAHKHQEDKAYDNVVLHVVYEHDVSVFRSDYTEIPTLELKNRISPALFRNYWKLLKNDQWIPCQHQFREVASPLVKMLLSRLVVERLEEKTARIRERLTQNKNNWEQTFYEHIARNFGVGVNSEPFELLARSLPLITLAKHKQNLFQLEALLFGQAGFLEGAFEEQYPQQLQKEYQFLQKKHGLVPLNQTIWKHSRLRPANFPTIRIAQFAQLLFQSTHLFSKIMNAADIKAIYSLFQVEVQDYWLTHYRFDRLSKKRPKKLGKSTFQLIIINTIAPFLFVYGKMRAEEHLVDRAIAFLEATNSEDNSIIRKWEELGVDVEGAADSQALLHLKKSYCDQRKCLSCSIGHKILQSKPLLIRMP